MQLDVFRKKIESYLRSTNTTRSKFERDADLTNSTISNILNEKITNPSISSVIKIADVIGCSLDELFSRKVENGRFFTESLKNKDNTK